MCIRHKSNGMKKNQQQFCVTYSYFFKRWLIHCSIIVVVVDAVAVAVVVKKTELCKCRED